ncbi:MAG: hypothetical protein ACRDOG_02350 [Gaiellaceae bacterium]
MTGAAHRTGNPCSGATSYYAMGMEAIRRLWEAITDDELSRQYTFAVGVTSDWTPGSRYESVDTSAGAPFRRVRETGG